MWLNHYQTEVLAQETSADSDMVMARHNGYRKLGVTHQRSIHLDKKQEKLSIVDQLLMDKAEGHEISFPLHLHPAVKVEKVSAHHFRLIHPMARPVEVQLPIFMDIEILHGSTDPILGWYSPSFQKKEPTHVILAGCRLDRSYELHTQIQVMHQ